MPTRGFTLVELVVSLVVIGLTVAVAAPVFSSLLPDDAAGPAEDVRALLVHARQRAWRNASDVEVRLDPLSGRYRLEERAGAGEPVVEEGALELGAAAPAAPAHGAGPAFRVVFRAVGIGTGDTLRLAGRLVRVDGVTGAVTVGR